MSEGATSEWPVKYWVLQELQGRTGGGDGGPASSFQGEERRRNKESLGQQCVLPLDSMWADRE